MDRDRPSELWPVDDAEARDRHLIDATVRQQRIDGRQVYVGRGEIAGADPRRSRLEVAADAIEDRGAVFPGEGRRGPRLAVCDDPTS